MEREAQRPQGTCPGSPSQSSVGPGPRVVPRPPLHSWAAALASVELHGGPEKWSGGLRPHSGFRVEPLRGGEGYNSCPGPEGMSTGKLTGRGQGVELGRQAKETWLSVWRMGAPGPCARGWGWELSGPGGQDLGAGREDRGGPVSSLAQGMVGSPPFKQRHRRGQV